MIEKSKKYLEIAKKEIKQAMQNDDESLAVDGCAKAWLAINLAINEFFIRKGIKENELPETYRGKWYFLNKYGDRNIRKIFSRAHAILHVSGYWDRLIIYEEINEIMEEIEKFIITL